VATNNEVLVAEHDQAVAELIRRYLAKEGLSVRSASTPEQTAAELAACRAAAVVLDLTMPGLDAREIRRLIRPRPKQPGPGRQPATWRSRTYPAVRAPGADVPVICLTAGEGTHSAQGLRPQDIGVDRDACLTRPFGPRTLAAKVRAAALSTRPEPAAAAQRDGQLSLNPAHRRATLDGAAIDLTGLEFDLLSYLMRHAGRTVSRAALRAAVWRDDGVPGDRIVDVYIAQVRAKLGSNHRIRTVRGIGYVFDLTAHDGTVNPGGQSTAQKPPATIGDAGHPTRGDSGTA
jgi:DNA-binding response OmpR family regulator